MNVFTRIRRAVKAYDDTHNFTCDICAREVFAGERICDACMRALPRNDGEICPFCGRKVLEAGACLECKEKPLKTARARSVCTHEREAARLVVRFKRGGKYLYRTLCDLMAPLLVREFPEADSITFVPMTKRAERKRGYNQSRLLAEELAARTDKEFLPLAVKTRETASQKTLGRRERESNLEGCFHVTARAAAKGRRIVIADDTMTTGATASELADALLRAGAKEVFLLTFTSVQKKEPFGKPPKKK